MFMQQMTLNQTLQAQVYDYTEAGLPLVYLYCTHFYHSPADLVRTFPRCCKLVVGSCEQSIKGKELFGWLCGIKIQTLTGYVAVD